MLKDKSADGRTRTKRAREAKGPLFHPNYYHAAPDFAKHMGSIAETFKSNLPKKNGKGKIIVVPEVTALAFGDLLKNGRGATEPLEGYTFSTLQLGDGKVPTKHRFADAVIFEDPSEPLELAHFNFGGTLDRDLAHNINSTQLNLVSGQHIQLPLLRLKKGQLKKDALVGVMGVAGPRTKKDSYLKAYQRIFGTRPVYAGTVPKSVLPEEIWPYFPNKKHTAIMAFFKLREAPGDERKLQDIKERVAQLNKEQAHNLDMARHKLSTGLKNGTIKDKKRAREALRLISTHPLLRQKRVGERKQKVARLVKNPKKITPIDVDKYGNNLKKELLRSSKELRRSIKTLKKAKELPPTHDSVVELSKAIQIVDELPDHAFSLFSPLVDAAEKQLASKGIQVHRETINKLKKAEKNGVSDSKLMEHSIDALQKFRGLDYHMAGNGAKKIKDERYVDYARATLAKPLYNQIKGYRKEINQMSAELKRAKDPPERKKIAKEAYLKISEMINSIDTPQYLIGKERIVKGRGKTAEVIDPKFIDRFYKKTSNFLDLIEQDYSEKEFHNDFPTGLRTNKTKPRSKKNKTRKKKKKKR